MPKKNREQSADKTAKSTLKFTPDIQNIRNLTTDILKFKSLKLGG